MPNPLTPEQQRAGAFAYTCPNGFLDARFDVASGRVDAVGRGFWDPDVAGSYFGNWAAMVEAIHAADRCLRAVVNLHEAAIQTLDVAALIKVCGDLHRGGDRIVLVVPSALMTLQMRRVLDPTCHRFFTCQNLAEAWIAEEDRILSAAA